MEVRCGNLGGSMGCCGPSGITIAHCFGLPGMHTPINLPILSLLIPRYHIWF